MAASGPGTRNKAKSAKRWPRFIKPPERSLRVLGQEASENLQIAEFAYWLFCLILGLDAGGLIAKRRFGLCDIGTLPRRLQVHARKLVEWGSKPGLLAGELLQARASAKQYIITLRQASSYGSRRRRIAETLRRKCSQAAPTGLTPTVKLSTVEVLGDEIGRPFGPNTLRKIQALGPSQVEVMRAGDAYINPSRYRLGTVELFPDGYSIERITMALPVQEAPPVRVIYGELEDFFETGAEGVIWSVQDEDADGYDGLHAIQEGDHLTILSLNGEILWQGIISCDRKAGWKPYPRNPKHGQPCALGHWVHWTHKGFSPDDWARYFIRPDGHRLRAMLKKKEVKRPAHRVVKPNTKSQDAAGVIRAILTEIGSLAETADIHQMIADFFPEIFASEAGAPKVLQSFYNLLQREGGSVDIDEAGKLLAPQNPTPRKDLELAAWRQELVAVEVSRQLWLFPKWQFSPEGGLLPGLKAVIDALRKGNTAYNQLTPIWFFTERTNKRSGKPPLEQLREGRVNDVIQQAKATLT